VSVGTSVALNPEIIVKSLRRRSCSTLVVLASCLAFPIAQAQAHTTQGSATPGNLSAHPWSSDGCSTPGANINSVPGTFSFLHSCIHHDGCYTGFPTNGTPTYWVSRLQCDTWFRADMDASCRWQHGPNPNGSLRGRVCMTTATTYYNAVRLFGSGYYGPVNN
jgi:hypothetical protein